MNYTEIVCMGIKTKDHSDFMNELNLRMILWSTAEAVLRRVKNIINNFLLILWSTAEAVLRQIFFWLYIKIQILWSTAEAVLRQNHFHNYTI